VTDTLPSTSSVAAARSLPMGETVYATLEGTVVRNFSPMVDGPPPEQGLCGYADTVFQTVGSVVSLPGELVDAGLAGVTSALVPPGMGMPAANIGLGMHLGLPHFHPQTVILGVPMPGFGPSAVVGSLNVNVGGMPALRCGDVGFALGCLGSPTFEIFTGSSSVFIGGKRAARAMDFTRHCDPFAALLTPGPAIGAALDIVSCAAATTNFAAHLAASATHDREAAEAQSPEAAEIAAAASAAEMQQAFVNSAQILADASLNAMTSAIGLIPPVGLMGDGLVVGAVAGTVLIGGLPLPGIADIVNAWCHHWIEHVRSSRRRAEPAHPLVNGSCGRVGEPIGVVEGNVFSDSVDADLAGFVLTRSYDTRARGVIGALGGGHRHGLERELRVWLHRATYVDERGTPIDFPHFRGRDHVHSRGYVLTRLGHGAYEVAHRGETMRFIATNGVRAARLVGISTPARDVAVQYGADELVESIDVGVDRFRFDYDAGRLARIQDGRGRSVIAYSYDRHGRLAWLRDAAGNREAFAYDPEGRLTQWCDKRGYRFEWRYDARGRCVFSTGEDGQWRTDLAYEPGKTLVTTGAGQVTTYLYDARGIVTRVTRADGGYLIREPDLAGHVVREIDAAGREVRWLYDATDAHVGRVDRFGHALAPDLEATVQPSPFSPVLPATLAPQMGFHASSVEAERSPSVPSSLEALVDWALPSQSPPQAPAEERDAMGRLVRRIDARGRATTYRRDPAGNVVESIDREGRVTRFGTVGWNLVGSVSDALGHRRELRYTSTEAVRAYRDANGNWTEYERDTAGRVSAISRNGVERERYVLDAGDRLREKRDGAGNRIFEIVPHANALPGTIVLGSGDRIQLDYDSRGRPTRASTTVHDVRLRRDADDLVLLDVRDGRGVRRERAGRIETTTVLDRFASSAELVGGVTVVRDPTGGEHHFDSGERGRVVRALSNGTREIAAFDEQGRLEGRLAHRLASDGALRAWAVRYERSAEGDLLSVWDSIRGRTTFDIDAAHRLAGETGPHGERISFVLDAADNVVEKPGLARAQYGAGNVLLETDRETFEHDARDRLSARRAPSGEVRYSYDSLDQLVRVEDGGEPWTATYDGIGRRCRFGRASASTELFWDGDRIAAELGPTGALRVHVYASAGALIPFMFVDYESVDAAPESGRSFFVFHDASGMPVQIEDASGRTVWWVDRVDPFGALDVHEGAEVDYRLRWPGHYADADLGLHYNRYRDYDPTLARYLQPDPIGHAGSPGSLYAYASNPLVVVDLQGLHEATHPHPTAEGEEPHIHPLTERPAESPEALAARHGREWAIDPVTRLFDAALTMCGIVPEEVERLARLPAQPGEARSVFRRRRYLQEREGRPVRALAQWARDGFIANLNREGSRPHEAAAIQALGAQSNNSVDPQTYDYDEWVDRNGRSLGSVFEEPLTSPPKLRARPPDAVGEPRQHTVRPDGLRGSDVIEHKHLAGTETVLHDSAQLRGETEMARRRGGRHELVISSAHGYDADGLPVVHPSDGAASGRRVYYLDGTTGKVTHTWIEGGWQPGKRD
jgi:RHS repeat-associated protein